MRKKKQKCGICYDIVSPKNIKRHAHKVSLSKHELNKIVTDILK